MARVQIDYTDGRFFWRPAEPHKPSIFDMEVPDTTLELWKACDRLNGVVQDQLRAYDDNRILGVKP